VGLKNKLKIFRYFYHREKAVYLLIAVCVIVFLGATYDEIVNDKNKQIEIVNRKIEKCRQIILNNSQITAEYNKRIDSINSAVNSIDDFLKDYKDETYLTADQIARETNTAINLEEEVVRIQYSFRSKIINLYKHGKNYELELLMSSKTPNEFLRRNQYLQKFAQNRKKELRELKSKKFILEEKKKMLNLSVSSRRFYVEAKRNEKALLQDKLKAVVTRNKEVEFQSNTCSKKINRLELELSNIKSYLNNFSENNQTYKDTKTPRLNYSSENFETIKGTINSPLDISLIRKEFGRNVNNSTNTESFNNGADFSAAEGSKVYSIASGIVTLTGEVPYYGKVIIVDHGNGYRSVYAVLSDVSVRPGDKIKLNQIIAKSGSNLDGQGLHFELWKDNTPLNPREWIRM
jgi:septal ring factor EnvC (AmiA/AmiB activator)